MIPIPNGPNNPINYPRANFSLLSPRIVDWDGKDDLKRNKNIMTTLLNKSEQSFSATSKLLKAIHDKQEGYLKSLGKDIVTFTKSARTTSPFITGLGSGHPTETGMILDRNTGLPYIPASSIKGVLRLAQAINCAISDDKNEINENDERIVKYFGTTQSANEAKRGQLIILDAYPADIPTLKLDIMNPHFGDYYEGKGAKQPKETETPNPIKFLTIEKGTSFIFRCVFLPLQKDTCDKEEVDNMFETAFKTVGFGGKTAIGYGRFEIK